MNSKIWNTEDKLSIIRLIKPFYLCEYWNGHQKMVTTENGRYIPTYDNCISTYHKRRKELLKDSETSSISERQEQLDSFIRKYY